ncbi:serine/threonine-protein phosphatase pp2a-related [Anaeramoeba flamelloides]|uniref:Serine/threonine-protein phosphatase n=1 Tax=Anaeramoeba flamelloides TaxID=1746091 RepID=A0ABQ8XUW7_9EUKA|nr:serine/threonine-protein phosphatase pp2a-related [Anaeramoeba flamelloides]
MTFNLDKMIEKLQKCEYPTENEIGVLCEKAIEVFSREKNQIEIMPPVTVCGDIHGQFYDLVELFLLGGKIPDTNYLFLGDWVDRGFFSLETLLLLVSLKVKYPTRVTMLRGNHEARSVTKIYGFYDEVLMKYKSPQVWLWCTNLFDYLPLTVLISGGIFCVHGGISPSTSTMKDIKEISRVQEVPNDGLFCDLLWSDPAEVSDFTPSPRGAGYLFGQKTLDEFLRTNNLSLVCRAHQLCIQGYKYLFNKKILTLWSAPNYTYRAENQAAILEIDDEQNQNIIAYDAAPLEVRQIRKF